MKHKIMFVLFGLVLAFNSLNNAYVGVYDNDERVKDITIEPGETYDLELEPHQTAYYFYDYGFGMITPEGVHAYT